jgi:antitoxin component of RelBE/YafQ-DinJ toxin-antitoxin module
MSLKKGKYEKKRQIIYMDKEVWRAAEGIFKDVGISRSKFIELTFRQLIRSEKVPMKEVYEGIVEDMFESSSKLKKKKVKQ